MKLSSAAQFERKMTLYQSNKNDQITIFFLFQGVLDYKIQKPRKETEYSNLIC